MRCCCAWWRRALRPMQCPQELASLPRQRNAPAPCHSLYSLCNPCVTASPRLLQRHRARLQQPAWGKQRSRWTLLRSRPPAADCCPACLCLNVANPLALACRHALPVFFTVLPQLQCVRLHHGFECCSVVCMLTPLQGWAAASRAETCCETGKFLQSCAQCASNFRTDRVCARCS